MIQQASQDVATTNLRKVHIASSGKMKRYILNISFPLDLPKVSWDQSAQLTLSSLLGISRKIVSFFSRISLILRLLLKVPQDCFTYGSFSVETYWTSQSFRLNSLCQPQLRHPQKVQSPVPLPTCHCSSYCPFKKSSAILSTLRLSSWNYLNFRTWLFLLTSFKELLLKVIFQEIERNL